MGNTLLARMRCTICTSLLVGRRGLALRKKKKEEEVEGEKENEGEGHVYMVLFIYFFKLQPAG